MPHYMAFHLGLHCFQKYTLMGFILYNFSRYWVKLSWIEICVIHYREKYRGFKQNCKRKIVNIFLPYVEGVQKNRLIERVLLSTHNICFVEMYKKTIFVRHSQLKA